MCRISHTRAGFTLIEMAVVLVIVGLLVGGIMAGQAMLRQSKLNKVTQEITSYLAAVKEFQTQYAGLPGDLPNAASYFSGAASGNGNGKIGNFLPVTDYGEVFQAPYQLMRAGLITGNYSGTGSGQAMVPGTNVPQSAVATNVGYTLVYWGGTGDVNNFTPNATSGYAMIARHALLFGTSRNGNLETYAPAISPGEAQIIDTKMDDGKPGLGRYIASSPVLFTQCSNSVASATAVYNTANSGDACGFYINAGF